MKKYSIFKIFCVFLVSLFLFGTDYASAKEPIYVQKEINYDVPLALDGCEDPDIVVMAFGPIKPLPGEETECSTPEEDNTLPEVDNTPLTDDEIIYLKNHTGLTEEMIDDIPIEELRRLIEEDAVLQSSVTEIIPIIEPRDPGQILPDQGGDLPEKKIKIEGYTYNLGIQKDGSFKGYRRLKFYGTWNWLSNPVNCWTDAFAVGWGVSDIMLPTKNNDVAEFYADYYRWDSKSQSYYLSKNATNTNSYAPNAGSGWKFDLRQGDAKSKGSITQYAYSRAKQADVNVMFSYGHARLVVSPTFTTGSNPFAVSSGLTVDVGYAATSIRW